MSEFRSTEWLLVPSAFYICRSHPVSVEAEVGRALLIPLSLSAVTRASGMNRIFLHRRPVGAYTCSGEASGISKYSGGCL